MLSPRQQAEIFWQAQSAWYVTLICSQFWHIWVCKTRVVSLKEPCMDCIGRHVCAAVSHAVEYGLPMLVGWRVSGALPSMSCVIRLLRAQASLFTHGIFHNAVTLYGVSVSVAVMVIVVYAPFLQVCCMASGGGRWHCCSCSLSRALPCTHPYLTCLLALFACMAAGHLWHLELAGHWLGATDRGAAVDAALLRVHKAHGAREPRRLVGQERVLVMYVPGTGSLCQGVYV